jgi:hypothetical protein
MAYVLVQRIDADLASGRRHYRDKAGVLLTTLEQVVRALIDGEMNSGGVGLGRSMKWLQGNLNLYRGRWVAIENGQLVGWAASHQEILDHLPDQRSGMIITKIPDQDELA